MRSNSSAGGFGWNATSSVNAPISRFQSAPSTRRSSPCWSARSTKARRSLNGMGKPPFRSAALFRVERAQRLGGQGRVDQGVDGQLGRGQAARLLAGDETLDAGAIELAVAADQRQRGLVALGPLLRRDRQPLAHDRLRLRALVVDE